MDRAGFFSAVNAGDAGKVESILAADPDSVHWRDDDGATALHIAAVRGHRELVDVLLRHGADMNARDGKFGATPAGWALHYLRERGAFLAIEIEDLVHAITSGDVVWTRRFILRHPRITCTRDAAGKPLAEYARESGVREIAELFGQGL